MLPTINKFKPAEIARDVLLKQEQSSRIKRQIQTGYDRSGFNNHADFASGDRRYKIEFSVSELGPLYRSTVA